MKVAATVTAHDFQLAVDGFDGIGGGEGLADRLRVLDESQVVRAFFAEFGDPSGGGLGKAIAEVFELTIGEFDIPAGFDGAPALLKFRGVGFGEMSLGIALHVNGTELNVGVGKQTLTDGQQSGKKIGRAHV